MKNLMVAALLCLTGAFSNANTLSEAVLSEKLSEKENYVFSNTSVDGLLSLISYGLTRDNQQNLVRYWQGKSLEQKSQAISALNRKSDGIDISVAYQIWLDQKYFFMPEYLADVAENFSVVPQSMNVGKPDDVVRKVNAWTAQNTNNLITNVIDQNFVTPDLSTILANAVYFKGEWKEKFIKELTSPKPFAGAGSVETMFKDEDVKFAYNKKDKVLTVELGFKGDTHSMILVMPAAITAYDEYFEDVPSEISYRSGNLQTMFKTYVVNMKAIKELEYDYSDGAILEMPKFTIDSSIEDLEGKLSQLGLSGLFQTGALFKMINHPGVKLSKVLQKAKIIVNEEGAEAAAVTVGGIVVVSEESPPVVLKLNGPFAYMILDKRSNERLFEGVVLNPSK